MSLCSYLVFVAALLPGEALLAKPLEALDCGVMAVAQFCQERLTSSYRWMFCLFVCLLACLFACWFVGLLVCWFVSLWLICG